MKTQRPRVAPTVHACTCDVIAVMTQTTCTVQNDVYYVTHADVL